MQNLTITFVKTLSNWF